MGVYVTQNHELKSESAAVPRAGPEPTISRASYELWADAPRAGESAHRAPRTATHDRGEGSPGAATSRKDEDESRGHSWAKPSSNTKGSAGLQTDTAALSQQLAGTDIRDAVTANRVAAPRGLQQTQRTTQQPPLAGAHPREPELSAPEASPGVAGGCRLVATAGHCME